MYMTELRAAEHDDAGPLTEKLAQINLDQAELPKYDARR